MINLEIKTLEFGKRNLDAIKKLDTEKIHYETNWPVVYILNDKGKAYIGETLNLYNRAKQHLANPKRESFKEIHVILNDKFNKSAILDIESFLIKYMSANRKLDNRNGGLSNHNYFQREKYTDKFKPIWDMLQERGLVTDKLTDIEFSDFFTYSPYKALTLDQLMAVEEIVTELRDAIKNHEKKTFVVFGTFGTGKTILATYLMKLLKNPDKIKIRENEEGNIEELNYSEEFGNLKYAMVVPQQALRSTIKKVFAHVDGLERKDAIGPYDIPKEKYDLLIVDEAHRLQRPIDLGQKYNAYHANVKRMGLSDDSTELDWVMHQSDYQILFYDEDQMIRATDIRRGDLYARLKDGKVRILPLTTQMRVNGGEEYIEYVKKIFTNTCDKKEHFSNYQFYLYNDIAKMRKQIIKLNKSKGYARLVAGYAWEWKSKDDETGLIYDIEIGAEKMRWNHTYTDWINSKNAINEVGCIHTVQGYDLNYCGIIIGPELDYDFENKKFVVYENKYKDKAGKRKIESTEELMRYILNIYKVLFTRGIEGTYVYACNENMYKYLKQFIDLK